MEEPEDMGSAGFLALALFFFLMQDTNTNRALMKYK